MKAIKIKVMLLLIFAIPVFLPAQDSRTVPLDVYLIIDTSEKFLGTGDEITTWINNEVIDRLLQQGDGLVIWSVGAAPGIVYTETIGSSRDEAKNAVRNLQAGGKNADFAAALHEATARAAAGGSAGRMNLTFLVSSSAENLAPSLGGESAGLFRWSRVELHSRWQVLVVAPAIDERVRSAAAAYMRGQ